MTLVEFLASERDRLLRFEEFWRQGNADDATYFPYEMDHSEWNQQYIILDEK
jgi:hypothetical protein